MGVKRSTEEQGIVFVGNDSVVFRISSCLFLVQRCHLGVSA